MVTREDAEKLLLAAIQAAGSDEFASPGYALGEELISLISKIIAERDEALKECEEQARLNGAGASREARLITERDELLKERGRWVINKLDYAAWEKAMYEKEEAIKWKEAFKEVAIREGVINEFDRNEIEKLVVAEAKKIFEGMK